MKKKSSYLKVSITEFRRIIERGLVITDCGCDWCGRCRLMTSLIKPIFNKYNTKIEFFRIDIEASREVKEEYGIYSRPTYLVFKDGGIIDRIDKLISQGEFHEKINSYINGFK